MCKFAFCSFQTTMESATSKITLNEFEVLKPAAGKKWDQKTFSKNLKIKFVKKKGMDLEFDLIGVDASLANAFRRILLSEVPSMAIEKVYIYNNTSIIQDEVLAHRLGLIPLKADPRLFQYKTLDTGDPGTPKDTLEFNLKVRCKKNAAAKATETDPNHLYIDHLAKTDKMVWVPNGDQAKRISDPGPVEDDILVAKLRPGHEIDVKLYAYKGLGRDHAKFSPVATAFYRLLPEITLNRDVTGEAAERLQKCFSPGVIELEDVDEDKKKGKKGKKKEKEAKSSIEDSTEKRAVVADARYDNCSRNVFRHDDLRDAVSMTKKRDHFIFTVESVGAVQPEDLFVMAIDILEEKCDHFLKELETAIKEGNT